MPADPVLPPGDHVAAEQVADLLEDLLPEDEAATVVAHLDSCADCSRLRDDLTALPALLADVPSPPLPVEVAARLDAAVAAAAAAREEQRARPATVTPLGSRRRRFVARTFTGVAAAAALVVGVLVVGDIGDIGGSGGDSDTASDSGGSAELSTEGGGSGDDLQRAPSPASARLARLTSDDFGSRAAALLSNLAAADATTLRGDAYEAGAGRLGGACSARDLRTARISGSLDVPVRLDGEPVTLVASGPRRRSLVVAYDCRTGTPVARQRAYVDLTR